MRPAVRPDLGPSPLCRRAFSTTLAKHPVEQAEVGADEGQVRRPRGRPRRVHQGEETIEINTKSIVLACGSFEANAEMRKEEIGEEWESAIVRGTEFNTGDGIEMALEVGAQKFGQWSGCHAIGTDKNVPVVGDFTKPGDIFKKHSYPLGIMLNEEGKRFVDEGADFRNYTYAKYGKEILKQPNNVAYQIFDSQVRAELREEYNLEEATSYEAETLEELIKKLPVNKSEFLKNDKRI